MATEFSPHEKLIAVQRELNMRRSVYARRVADGKMSAKFAEQQIAVFEAIERDYRAAAEEVSRQVAEATGETQGVLFD